MRKNALENMRKNALEWKGERGMGFSSVVVALVALKVFLVYSATQPQPNHLVSPNHSVSASHTT